MCDISNFIVYLTVYINSVINSVIVYLLRRFSENETTYEKWFYYKCFIDRIFNFLFIENTQTKLQKREAWNA